MKMTPDFLRGEAVAQIVGTMHTRPQGGSWSLEHVETTGRRSVLVFAVGIIMPALDGTSVVDERQRVRITVEEIDASS